MPIKATERSRVFYLWIRAGGLPLLAKYPAAASGEGRSGGNGAPSMCLWFLLRRFVLVS